MELLKVFFRCKLSLRLRAAAEYVINIELCDSRDTANFYINVFQEMYTEGCLVLVGKDIDAVGRQFKPYPYRRMLFPNCRGIKAAANPRLTFNM